MKAAPVEMLNGLMQGADRDLVKIWQKMNAKRFGEPNGKFRDDVKIYPTPIQAVANGN